MIYEVYKIMCILKKCIQILWAFVISIMAAFHIAAVRVHLMTSKRNEIF